MKKAKLQGQPSETWDDDSADNGETPPPAGTEQASAETPADDDAADQDEADGSDGAFDAMPADGSRLAGIGEDGGWCVALPIWEGDWIGFDPGEWIWIDDGEMLPSDGEIVDGEPGEGETNSEEASSEEVAAGEEQGTADGSPAIDVEPVLCICEPSDLFLV